MMHVTLHWVRTGHVPKATLATERRSNRPAALLIIVVIIEPDIPPVCLEALVWWNLLYVRKL